MEDNQLNHHGVLGMKWGVRRARKSSGVDKTRKREPKKKPTDGMSDQELRNRINRLQMEKQYVQLTKKDTSAGRKFVTDIIVNAAKQTATSYVSKYMTKGVDALGGVVKTKVLHK